jgi:hypothetical protein
MQRRTDSGDTSKIGLDLVEAQITATGETTSRLNSGGNFFGIETSFRPS